MEGDAAAAVLQVLVQNLIDHSMKEFSLVRGLKKEAEKLTESLDTIKKFLNDAEMRTIPGEAVKSWLKMLENAAFYADNVLDEFSYHQLCKQIKPIKPMKQKVLSCFSSCVNLSHSRSMAIRIQEINEKLKSINNEATDLGLKETLATNVSHLPDATFETDSFTLVPIFIGRDKEVSDIVEMLTACITSDERVCIISIVGMGGSGKTTLTRKVFHLLKEKKVFGSHIWVHVSQIFDPVLLLKKILKELTSSDQVEVESRQGILNKIQEALKDKSYLLILDDVWNEDRPTWDGFIQSLLGVSSNKGNAIVVTTRKAKVPTTVSAIHTHELEGLSKEDCWSIIKERTFGKEKVPLGFEAIGIEIAEKCQGLPLAASVVSGILRDKKSDEEWHSIKENWLSSDEGGYITKILKLSFDNLSLPSLKKCFAYCSIFPKGHRIKRRELIEYWMGEGFLVAYESNGMESVGDKYINVLIHNSLLQIVERDDYGNVESCVMHDLVHDLAFSVLAGSHNADGISPVRYMLFEEKSIDVLKQNAKYLRTLLSMDHSSMFSDFESLRVLTLGSGTVEELPSSIMKLIHLRVLDINRSSIEHLPDWIGKLVHLQTLRADVYGLKQLPSTLKYLTNLRHLYIRRYVQLPAGIGKLTSLQTLEYFNVGDKDGWKIEELGSLNGLRGKLVISKLERVENKEEAKKASLSAKSKLLELCLTWDEDREGEITSDENVLEGLQPHTNLKKLEIEGYKGKRFPLWTRKMEVEKVGEISCVPLNNLTEIYLVRCYKCEEIPMFGQLPNLVTLWLEEWFNLKSISSSFYGLEKGETRIVFPALKILVLAFMNELTEWAEVESSDVKVFPQLQRLKIEECPKLKGFPREMIGSSLENLVLDSMSSLENLPGIIDCLSLMKLKIKTCSNLKELIIKECPNLKELNIKKCQNLKEFIIKECPNLKELNIKKCQNLKELIIKEECPNLKELIINECQNLKELIIKGCPNLIVLIISVCPNLKELITKECPNLKGLYIYECPDLKELIIKECLESLNIVGCNALQYFPCEMIGTSIERLELEKIGSLKNLPEIIECLRKSPHLTHLIIRGAPQFMPTCLVDILPCFNSLEWLELDASMGGSIESVDALLQACRRSSHSLQHLEFKGIKGSSWVNLVESLQHLTALNYLYLETIGMESLPQWLKSMNARRRSDYNSYIHINGERIYMPLTELLTLLNSGNPTAEVEEVEEEAEVEAKDEEAGEAAEAKEEESKRGNDLCLSLRCFQRARR
ncbi:putative disease resistance protein RGA3 [Salvia hispanica]|uniref:putative disease resistance protein RGA3 n=1 Tax=Salvia hispanica TaxID=49212 RepID=UPI00200932DD|nr:putative disease resistance protein RGA3 [Salvia hispanica]